MSEPDLFTVGDLTGHTALVTGASAGIGAAFARELARRGADIVLVARRADRLAALADELRTTGRSVHILPADLTAPRAVASLTAFLTDAGLTIDLLVNNAGVGLPHEPFSDADPVRLRGMLDLNIGVVTELTHVLLPGMIARGRGAVIMMSSGAAFQPVPYLAAYAATKAFVLSLAEALWAETRGTGVRVLAVCPGLTATEFFDQTGPQVSSGQVQTAPEVVAETMRALRRDVPTVVTGRRNALVASLPRLLPRSIVARISERASRTPAPVPHME